jgi:hypothetical protein
MSMVISIGPLMYRPQHRVSVGGWQVIPGEVPKIFTNVARKHAPRYSALDISTLFRARRHGSAAATTIEA